MSKNIESEEEDLDKMLELYYNSSDNVNTLTNIKPIYDLNSNSYDSQLHVNKLLHEKTLKYKKYDILYLLF